MVIPSLADSGHGGGPVPADLHTPSSVEGLGKPTAGCDTPGSLHRAIRLGPHPSTTGNPQHPAGDPLAGLAAITPRGPIHTGAGVGVSRGDGAGRSLPPGTSPGVPPWDATHAGSPGDYQNPGCLDAGTRPPLDGGHYPPLWDFRRL